MLIKKDIWNSGNKVAVVKTVVWLLVDKQHFSITRGLIFIAKYVLIPSFKNS